ncbi:unnamed protein product [Paramecium octaurelia]|uniref:FCP1 homology domain-containing protein n=1 Tax=Paramecium octaurelia TaxID=43137 RepID=A0A8S1S709_PAROT|nr:unnamed protein product [Paramecium octaurelia]
MNTNDIIYQQQQEQIERQPNCLEKLCSCIYFFHKKTHKTNQKYQLGIDSPKSHCKKVCVLDLDETLVHSQFKPDNGYDFLIDIIVQSQLFKVFVTLRPGVENFIENLSEYYEIIMWTASLKEYADPVMNIIDPQRRALTRLYRQSCTSIQGGLTKNLHKLGRNLKDVLIVDMSFIFQPENGFLIKDFTTDKNDTELESLLPFLIWLSQQSDVRPVSQLYKQYAMNELKQKKHSKRLILSQTMILNNQSKKNKVDVQIQRTHTANYCDGEEIELRADANLNSPKLEIKLDDQTDDESREIFEISSC